MTAVPKTVAEAIAELRAQGLASVSLAKGHPVFSRQRAEHIGEARAYRDAARLLEQMPDEH